MNENEYQRHLKKRLKQEFPNSIVTKMDANDIQGIPDILILHNKNWAALECKKDAQASKRPNQEYYVEKMDGMSFARFVYPDNEEDVINELHKTFKS